MQIAKKLMPEFELEGCVIIQNEGKGFELDFFYTEENNEVCSKQSVFAVLSEGGQDIIFFVLFLNQALTEDRSSLVVQ